MTHERKFITREYPGADRTQVVMLAALTLVWGLDSFLLKLTTIPGSVPWPLRLVACAGFITAGSYLVYMSHRLVIDEVTDPVLVDWGVYGLVRHPMYLGIQLCYLGVALSTVSLASFLALGFVFLVYNRFAEFEEKELTGALGHQYLEYMRRVPRWVPSYGSKRHALLNVYQ